MMSKAGFDVVMKRRVERDIERLPVKIRDKMLNLVDDLREKGPIQANWPNYSKLSDSEHHCHLSYKWVACWKHDKGTIVIEVYYAGSRENAPY
jgi:mRNA-degrading endonuclease RelE of RelBE toxin-antitoxin system